MNGCLAKRWGNLCSNLCSNLCEEKNREPCPLRYGYGGYELYCTSTLPSPAFASLYFTSMIIIVGQIMMSLFVGIITNKMEDAALEIREKKAEIKRLAATSRTKIRRCRLTSG